MKPRDKEREGKLELWMIEMSHNRSCGKVKRLFLRMEPQHDDS